MRTITDTLRYYRLKRVVFCLAMVVAVGTVYGLLPVHPTQKRYEQVREGMTWEEVVGLLGEPGDHTDGEYQQAKLIAWKDNCATWLCEEGEFVVAFDENSRVFAKYALDSKRVWFRPTWWERFAAKMGL